MDQRKSKSKRPGALKRALRRAQDTKGSEAHHEALLKYWFKSLNITIHKEAKSPKYKELLEAKRDRLITKIVAFATKANRTNSPYILELHIRELIKFKLYCTKEKKNPAKDWGTFKWVQDLFKISKY